MEIAKDVATVGLEAAAIAIAVPAIIAVLWNRARASYYRRFDTARDPAIADILKRAGFPAALREKYPLSAEALADHHRAGALQSAYQFWLAFAVSALAIGFVGLAFSATLGRESHHAILLSALVDVWALVLVVIAYRRGVAINRRWINARVEAEMGRQRETLRWIWEDVAVADAAAITANGVEAVLAATRQRVSREVAAAKDVMAWIRQQWAHERGRLRQAAPSVSLSAKSAGIYLHRRPIRQAHWFHSACHRLEHQMTLRERFLLLCFIIVILASIAKVVTVASGEHGPYYEWKYFETFIILVFLAIATWMTALFVGQNSRSLVHRYLDQLDRIHTWFDAHLNPVPAALPPEAVLNFEDLMIEELISWVEITTHDRIELSP